MMFHCFHSQAVKFSKRYGGRVVSILPLDSTHIVTLDENNSITQYKIPSGSVAGHLILPFKARKMVIGSDRSVLALAVEERAIYQVFAREGKVDLVVKFEASHHYHTQQVQLREREYFSTMMMGSFNEAQACYLRQERAEQRKLRLHFLTKEQSGWRTAYHEHPLNGSITEKMDQNCKLAIWKQQIANAGEFDFTILDLQTMTQEDVHLDSGSFTIFTIVRAVKQTSEGLLVSLNHKNPQILIFKSNVQTKSQNLQTNLLRIVTTQLFLLTVCLSEDEKSQGHIELRRTTGQLMDNLESSNEEIAVSRNGELVVEYDRERKDTGWMIFTAVRVIRKEKLYLHLMESLQVQNALSNGFMRQVISLLK